MSQLCRWTIVMLVLLAAGAKPPAWAQSEGSGSASTPALLVIQNRPVFLFRTPLGPRSPQERMEDALLRLDALLEAGHTDSIALRQSPQGALILVGGRGIFAITPGDVDSLSSESLAELSGHARENLELALSAAREQRSLSRFLWSIGLALVATVFFLITCRLIRVGHRFLQAHLPALAIRKLPKVRVGGFRLLDADRLLAFLRRLIDGIAWVVGLLAAYIWLTYTLTRFPYSRPWGEALGDYLLSILSRFFLSAMLAVPGLFTVFLIFLFTRFLARWVTAFFAAVEKGEVELPWLHADTANPTRRIATALLWLFAVILSYPYLPGSGSEAFKGVSVFAGLMLSLASTGVISQAMGGLVLMYSRALKPGDYVRIDEVEGTVVELSLLSTKIRTPKREWVTLPNAVIVGKSTKNYSRLADGPGVILHTTVTIGYDVPWKKVHDLLIAAARATENVLAEPGPFVRQTSLDDFYVSYQINLHTNQADLMPQIYSDLHQHIQDQFHQAGVEILSPHYAALRDGNQVAIPEGYLPATYLPPSFRVTSGDAAPGAPREKSL